MRTFPSKYLPVPHHRHLAKGPGSGHHGWGRGWGMLVGKGRVLVVSAGGAKLWPGEGWRRLAGLWPSRIAPVGFGEEGTVTLGCCWLSSHRDGTSRNRAVAALPSPLAGPNRGD